MLGKENVFLLCFVLASPGLGMVVGRERGREGESFVKKKRDIVFF